MERNGHDEVLTTREAVRYLKISRPTYFKCIRLGRINATKVGNGWRVLRSELNRFLKSGCRNDGAWERRE